MIKELRSRKIKARLRLGIERVKLAQRIEALKREEGNEDEDLPQDANRAADEALSSMDSKMSTKDRLSRAAKADIFRAVVLAKTKEMRDQKENDEMEKTATQMGNMSVGKKSNEWTTRRY